MSINFIESSDVNGKPIWLNTEHIVSFGVKEMAIKAKHGVGFKDGLWVKCLDCTNSEYEFYIIDETPKSFLEKISNINCVMALEENGLRNAVIKSVTAAYDKTQEMKGNK